MALAVLAQPAISQSAETLNLPVKPYRILQSYANRPGSFRNNYHCADDIYANGGAEVYATADGNIVFSGKMDGYGWLIVIDHPQLGIYSLYGHLSSKREKRALGAVKANERIAFIADDHEDGSAPRDGSGRYPYWGPHLHFGIRKGSKADYSDNTIDRWMAGYTPEHPSKYGWIDPKTLLKR